MDVRIISLKSSCKSLSDVQKIYPEARITSGVDVRGVSIGNMVQTEMITTAAAHSLVQGRKWHHELPTRGAVGVHQAMQRAIGDTGDRHLLLFEDDVFIPDPIAFKAQVDMLAAHSDKFDVAVFGFVSSESARNKKEVEWAKGWLHCDGMFILLHCVLYTAHARPMIAELLERPQEAQIDALYSWWASQNKMRIILHPGLARQKNNRLSGIQIACPLCEITPTPVWHICFILIVIVVALGLGAHYTFARMKKYLER